MPKKLHEKLKKQAKKLGLKGDEADKYVYGTMSKNKRNSGKKKRRQS